jgi:hypothetical protein
MLHQALTGVYVSGSYAYVADGYKVRIIDISDPDFPFEVGFYDTPDWPYWPEVVEVYIAGSYAYFAGGGLT